MKVCPLCHRCYEDRFISCAHDRTTLISDRPGAMRLKEADAMRPPHRHYATYATALILGLVGGLLFGSRGASVSSPTTSQVIPAAEAAGQTEPITLATTTSDVKAADVVTARPEGAERPSNTAMPVIGHEQLARPAPPADKLSSSKDPGANPSAASAEPHGGKAAIGSYVSDGRGPQQRQGVGPCRLLVSALSLSIRAGGGRDTITVSSQNADGAARVAASTKNWPDINVFPESRGNPGGPARYSVISVSKRAGTYSVNFESPCGKTTVPVTVQ